jgi:hypothetical protein
MQLSNLANFKALYPRPWLQRQCKGRDVVRGCSTSAAEERFTITTPLYYANAGTLKLLQLCDGMFPGAC